MRYVRDVHAEPPAVRQCFDGNSVVKIARGRAVDGEDQHISQIDAPRTDFRHVRQRFAFNVFRKDVRKAMRFGYGAHARQHAGGVAQNALHMSAYRRAALRVGVYGDQRQLVVAHKAQVAVQRNGIGNARVAGRGGCAHALEIALSSAAAVAVEAHAAADGDHFTGADLLDLAIRFAQRAAQEYVVRQRLQAVFDDAQPKCRSVGKQHGRAAVGEDRSAANEPQQLRKREFTLARSGGAAVAHQRIHCGLHIFSAIAALDAELI